MRPSSYVYGNGTSYVCSATFRINGTRIGWLEAWPMVNIKDWYISVHLWCFWCDSFTGIEWECWMKDFFHSLMSDTRFGQSFWLPIPNQRLPFNRPRNHFIWSPLRPTCGLWSTPLLPSNSVKYLTPRSIQLNLIFCNFIFFKARIGNGSWRTCRLSGQTQPLYTLPWQPELYAAGLHTLQVRVRDESGSENQIEIEFSLDGSRPVPAVLKRFLLLMDLTTFFAVHFCGLFSVSLIWWAAICSDTLLHGRRSLRCTSDHPANRPASDHK